MATDENYPIDIPILVIEAQIFVAVKKFPFLPNKQITTTYIHSRIINIFSTCSIKTFSCSDNRTMTVKHVIDIHY